MKRSLLYGLAVSLALVVLLPTVAWPSARDMDKFGITGGYNLGDKLADADIAFNATGWFRLQVGYAFPVVAPKRFNPQLEGAGKFFVPQWDFSPYAGVGSGPQSGTLAVLAGLDYTAPGGFNIGAGWSQVGVSGASGTQVYVGLYF